MRVIIIVLFYFVFPGNINAQFSIFVEMTTDSTMDVKLPSGTGERILIIHNRDSFAIDSLELPFCNTGCIVTIEDLEPATIYLLRLIRNGLVQDERWSITSSHSSGEIKVFFTTTVDDRVSSGLAPDGLGGAVLESAIVEAIGLAEQSIDVMLYNINRRPVSNALIAAHQRGVRVRYLTSDNTSNSALSNPTPPFPILVGNLGDGLMHNKVFVIDAQIPEKAWVITGATNMTTGQIYNDHNNTLFIQDQSLALVYEKEVNEMWGSNMSQPNIAKSRFGSNKLDDTPHEVYINGQLIQVYFSPSDNTSFHMINAINRVQNKFYINLMLFTRRNLASALVNLHNRGVDVKGLIDDVTASSSEFDFLLSNGVFVLDYEASVILHHKYAIGDVGVENANPFVITGSHNWTNSAETRNDENTLIIYSDPISRIYLMEFQARWCETFTGQDCLLLTSTDITSENLDNPGFNLHFDPSSKQLFIFSESDLSYEYAMIVDVNGKPIMATTPFKNSQSRSIQTYDLPAGTYFLILGDTSSRVSKAFVVTP